MLLQAEADVMATAGSDRGIALYDLRTSTPIRKLIMQTKTNSIAWNPMEAFNFTAANEDCCLYTYDMRKLQSATCVHKDFVSAVMDVDYSPTGREFVAGSYDRSVRIFSHNGGHSKEVYHTKRMQRVFAVRFSGDGSYVFSGSDDMNVRVWKVSFCAPPQLCAYEQRADGLQGPRAVLQQQHEQCLADIVMWVLHRCFRRHLPSGSCPMRLMAAMHLHQLCLFRPLRTDCCAALLAHEAGAYMGSEHPRWAEPTLPGC